MAVQWLNSVFARLLPQDCALCGAPSGDDALCTECVSDLPFNLPACVRCALPMTQTGVCGHCRRHPQPFASATALLRWQAPVDYLIHHYKYNAQLAIGKVLAELLATHLDYHIETPPDLLIPTPLHPRRLRSRGFNQALEIGTVVAQRLDLPIAIDAIERSRPTTSQTGLDPRQRRRNIRGAFRVPDHRVDYINGKRVAVLDDVLTTGSTAAEISRVLLRAGATEVDIWTLARSAGHRK